MTKQQIVDIAKAAEQKKKESGNKALGGRHLTDLGNAELFAAMYNNRVKFCPIWNKWLVWDGARWKIDDMKAVYNLGKATIQQIYRDALEELDDNTRKQLIRHALASESCSRINAMLELAKSEPSIAVAPEILDSKETNMLLNVKNGTINLKTGELLPADPENHITKIADVEYQENAKAPLWEEFLMQVMDNNTDLINFLQRAVGYSLTSDVSEQCLFICYGTGANGKSVFLQTLLNLAGEYGRQVSKDLLIKKPNGSEEHPTVIAELLGKRVAVTIEADEDSKLNEASVKWFTGNDKLSARFMRGDYFEFLPTHKLWFATNHKPTIRGTDNGIWRRIKLIPFNVTIPEEKQDKQLINKLTAELPGILAWAVQGCLLWQQEGLITPKEVINATNSYRAEMDVLADFLSQCTEAGGRVYTGDLYNIYELWCRENGEVALSQRQLAIRLQEKGYTKTRSNGKNYWINLQPRSDYNVTEHSLF